MITTVIDSFWQWSVLPKSCVFFFFAREVFFRYNGTQLYSYDITGTTKPLLSASKTWFEVAGDRVQTEDVKDLPGNENQ